MTEDCKHQWAETYRGQKFCVQCRVDAPSDVELHQTQYAEMAPDLYRGDSCDKVRPRWACYAEGDRGGPSYETVLQLDARHFPVGTVISIQEPKCPECGELPEPRSVNTSPESSEPLFGGKCRCGFDWDVWRDNRYS